MFKHRRLLFLDEGGGILLGLPWSSRVSGCVEALGRQSRRWEALAAVASQQGSSAGDSGRAGLWPVSYSSKPASRVSGVRRRLHGVLLVGGVGGGVCTVFCGGVCPVFFSFFFGATSVRSWVGLWMARMPCVEAWG